MARPLRIEFENAIYHVMARGNARQKIFLEDEDYRKLADGLARTVERCGWLVMAYCWMPNHLHLFLRTPHSNLSRGMQRFLSGYANWFTRRHRRPGHLFQGRFRGELIEDESYYWNVSRYIHLNPVRGKRPLASHPAEWPWSSYAGYRHRRQRQAWVAYQEILTAWQGEMGGRDAERAYRRFVESGVKEPPTSPFRDAVDGWLLGSQAFVDRMRDRLQPPHHIDDVPRARRLCRLDPISVIAATADHYGVAPDAFRAKRSGVAGRDLAAWLAAQLTSATQRELAPYFGLTHPDSIRNLTRRVDVQLKTSRALKKDVKEIRSALQKTVNRV